MRYYSTTAGEMILQTAVAAGDTTVVVNSTAGLPVTYPYTLFLDYGSISEEVVDVTAAAGTSLTVVRGQDGTVAQAHAFGAKIRHGVSARDYRESREHEAATAAHGVAAVAGLTEAQTLDNKTFQPSGDHAAVVLRPVAANTAPAEDVRDEANARMAGRFATGLQHFFGGNAVLTAFYGGAVNVYKSILELRVSDDINALTGKVSGAPTGRFLRLLNGATELFSVDPGGIVRSKGEVVTGNISATGDVSSATATVSGNASVGGTLSGPTVTALQNADSSLSSTVTANRNSSMIHPYSSAKRMAWAMSAVTFSAGVGTITHGLGFTPSFVIANATPGTTMLTVAHNDVRNATTFQVRCVTDTGPYTGTLSQVWWIAVE